MNKATFINERIHQIVPVFNPKTDELLKISSLNQIVKNIKVIYNMK